MTDKAPGADTPHRYPGPPPFQDTPEDRHVFFGRRTETDSVAQLVTASRLVVLFAKSGLGKTSLLNAGVFPSLRGSAFLPVPLRVQPGVTPLAVIKAALKTAAAAKATDATIPEAHNLWELFKTATFWRDDILLTPVLVFDQFEEVFTLLHAEERAAWARDIGSLASDAVPAAVRDHQRALAKARRASAETKATDQSAQTSVAPEFPEAGLSDRAPDVKLVLSLREDYLAALQELTLEIPQVFQCRFRLLPLSDSQAADAIREPARLNARPGSTVAFKTPTFEYDDETIAGILRFLRGQSGQIESWELQLLCSHLERHVVPALVTQRTQPHEPIRITPEHLGGADAMRRVLQTFFDEAINNLPLRQRARARELCDSGLVSSEGRRRPLDREAILRDWRVSTQTLDQLEFARVLRREPRLESIFYEISHDTLAETILARRPWRLPRRWRAPVIAIGVILACCLALGILAVAGIRAQRDRANQESIKANQARTRSEKLVMFLISDDLQDKLDRIGQTMAMGSDIKGQIDDYLKHVPDNDAKGTPLVIRGLADVNDGKVAYLKGDLGASKVAYERAVAELAPPSAQGKAIDASSVRLKPAPPATRTGATGASSAGAPLPAMPTTGIASAPLAQALEGLSAVLVQQGKSQEALAKETEALELRKLLAQQDEWDERRNRKWANAELGIADILHRMGRLTDAAQHSATALRLASNPPAGANSPPERRYIVIDAHCTLGQIAERQMDYRRAELAYRQALQEADTLTRDIPFELRAYYSQALVEYQLSLLDPRLGAERASPERSASSTTLLLQGESTKSQAGERVHMHEEDKSRQVDTFDKLLKTVDTLGRAEQDNLQWKRESSAAAMWVGWALEQREDFRSAERTYRQSLEAFEKLTQKEPTSVAWREDVVWAHQSLAGLLKGKPRLDELRTAITLAQEIARDDPFNYQAVSTEIDLETQLGRALREQKNFTGATTVLETAKSRIDGTSADPTNGSFLELKSQLEMELMLTKESRGEVVSDDDKIRAAERALDTSPGSPNIMRQYANVLKALGERQRNNSKKALTSFETARRCLERASELAPSQSRANLWNQAFLLLYDQLAPLRLARRDYEGTLEAYRQAADAANKAVDLKQDDAALQFNLALAERKVGDAQLLLKQSKYQDVENSYIRARDALNKAIKSEESSERWNELFLLYYDAFAALHEKRGLPILEDLRAAEVAIQHATGLMPRTAVYRSNLALLYQRRAGILRESAGVNMAAVVIDDRAGLAAVEDAARLAPKDHGYVLELARAKLRLARDLLTIEGTEAEAMKLFDGAVETARRAANSEQDDAAAWNLLAVIRFQQALAVVTDSKEKAQAALDDGVAAANRAIELKPNEPLYKQNLDAATQELAKQLAN